MIWVLVKIVLQVVVLTTSSIRNSCFNNSKDLRIFQFDESHDVSISQNTYRMFSVAVPFFGQFPKLHLKKSDWFKCNGATRHSLTNHVCVWIMHSASMERVRTRFLMDCASIPNVQAELTIQKLHLAECRAKCQFIYHSCRIICILKLRLRSVAPQKHLVFSTWYTASFGLISRSTSVASASSQHSTGGCQKVARPFPRRIVRRHPN